MINDDNRQREDLVNEIDDYEQKEHVEAKVKEQRKKKREIEGLGKKLFSILLICAVLFLSVKIMITFVGEIQKLTKKTYWAVGQQRTTDYKINEGVRNLWKIRKAIDMYYAANKNFPNDLNILYEKKYLRNRLLCPASGNGYIIKELEGKQVICCPNPREHGLAEFYIYVKSGPPVIKRR